MRRVVATLLVSAATLLGTSAATAKDFGPGDLRFCSATRCVTVTDRPLLHALGTFIYGGPQPRRAATPLLGAPMLQLRFRGGYVAGVVGGTSLDRFRSHGVICGRFQRGRWYRLAPGIAHELRRTAGNLAPLYLTAKVPRSC